MRVLIVEDEAIAAEHLSRIILDLKPDWEILGQIPSIADGEKWFANNNTPDLVFSDIQLTDGLSFELYDKIGLSCPIIFTTAYDQYAIKAFEVTSVDYLLKPIQKERVEEALQKMEEVSQAVSETSGSVDIRQIMDLVQKSKTEYKSRFLAKSGSKIVAVKTSEIAYFHSENKLTFLLTFNGGKYPVDYSLDELEALLDPSEFLRANRQFIIHLDAPVSIKPHFKGRIKLELQPSYNGEVVLSPEKTQAFKAWLDR